MKKTYYEITRENVEISKFDLYRKHMTVEQVISNRDVESPEIVARFESKEEANATFEELGYNVPDVLKDCGNYFYGEIYAINESTFDVDEDGKEEFDEGTSYDATYPILPVETYNEEDEEDAED